MAITAAFTLSQSANGTTATITETTNYSEAAGDQKSDQTTRNIVVTYSDMTTDEIAFPYTGTGDGVQDTITFTMDWDKAVNIALTITPDSPQPGSVYTYDAYAAFTGFSSKGLFDRMYALDVDKSVVDRPRWITNTMKLDLNITTAKQAAKNGDLVGSQQYLDENKNIIDGVLDATYQ